MNIDFLTVSDALYIHRNQIDRYGGEQGVRDARLLDSALAQPQASYGDQFLHSYPFEMAAAYLYHTVRNHPFVDGNKRTGAILALVFLDWNGVLLIPDNEGLVDVTVRTAEGRTSKDEVAAFLQSIAKQ